MRSAVNPKTTTLYRSAAENGGDWVGPERSEDWRVIQDLGTSTAAATWHELQRKAIEWRAAEWPIIEDLHVAGVAVDVQPFGGR